MASTAGSADPYSSANWTVAAGPPGIPGQRAPPSTRESGRRAPPVHRRVTCWFASATRGGGPEGPAATMRRMAVSRGPALPVSREDGDADRFLNRELSWLDFNARVLALAEDSTRPLLERAKFLAIFSMNLDEFFQVRVSGLQEQVAAGIRTRSPDGLDPLETIRAIREQVRTLVERQTTIFTKDVAPGL